MKSRRHDIRQAVILAAGNGRRMASAQGLPKPLTPVGPEPLIDHILGHLNKAGMKKVFVVVGYRADEIRRHLDHGRFAGLVETIHNPHYERPNGVSLLCAHEQVRERFLLLMSDHLFEAESLQMVIDSPPPDRGGVLAVDSKLDRIFDLDDATKVQSWNGKLARLGKDLREFDAVDTGMFALTPAVFGAMRQSIKSGDESLSGGIGELARRHLIATRDIGPRRWIDVDTPEAAAEAERLWRTGLFQFNGARPTQASAWHGLPAGDSV